MGSPPTLDLRAPTAWLRRFARTTPGVVAMIAVAVAVGCIIAAVVCVAQLNARIAERQRGSRPFRAARLLGAKPVRRSLGRRCCRRISVPRPRDPNRPDAGALSKSPG